MQEHEQVFFELPLLAKLPPEDLRALAAIARVQHFRAGSVIFRQGEAGDSFHAVLEGRVRIAVILASGAETTMAVMGPGECFGEFAILDGRPRSATALCVEPTRTLSVTRPDFVHWLSDKPRAALLLLETLSLRLRATNEALIDLAFFDLPHRMVRRLLRLTMNESTANTARPVRLAITQSGLASLLGVSRESVNKQLRVFTEKGWLTVSRGSVTIVDVEALRAYDSLD
jgi:CRP/FNR family cyclic AMP-dependent transcriptional regulator